MLESVEEPRESDFYERTGIGEKRKRTNEPYHIFVNHFHIMILILSLLLARLFWLRFKLALEKKQTEDEEKREEERRNEEGNLSFAHKKCERKG
jgi:hypothetical protein